MGVRPSPPSSSGNIGTARYMDVLFPMTVAAIKTDVEEVAMLAVEFWSTLCETETNLGDGKTETTEV
jgi:hypothetical protein